MGKRKYISRLVCIVLCSCLFFGCTKTQNEGENLKQEEQENLKQQQEENIAENNKVDDVGSGEKNIPRDDLVTPMGSAAVEDETIDVKFEILDNYKEKNIPSVYAENNKKEQYCNVILNKNREIEYYTIAEEEDGYHVWKYTLIENEGGSFF